MSSSVGKAAASSSSVGKLKVSYVFPFTVIARVLEALTCSSSISMGWSSTNSVSCPFSRYAVRYIVSPLLFVIPMLYACLYDGARNVVVKFCPLATVSFANTYPLASIKGSFEYTLTV